MNYFLKWVLATACIFNINTSFSRDVLVNTSAELAAACTNALDGDIILINPGTYQGPFVLNGKNNVTLQNNNGPVYLEGSSSESTNGIIVLSITNSNNIIVKDLVFRENWGNFADGIQIRGFGDGINISNCEFYNIGWSRSKTTLPNAGQNAHAIVAVGSTATPIQNLFIGGNSIHDCITGYSESMTLAGNVRFFLIEGNTLKSNTNIGIDAAGHFSWTGAPADVNFSRSGIIRKNIVSDYAGPAELDAAGGIYVDGGSFVTVENNLVYNYKVGYSIGCEVPNNTNAGNIVRNNIAYNCSLSGLFVGSNTTSSVQNTQVTNNTFYKCGFGTFDNGQIAFQNNSGTIVKNNILYPTPFRTAMVQMGGTTSSSLTISHNLYWRDSGNTDNLFFNVDGNQNAVKANPLFADATNADFHLQQGSPAINAGDSSIDVEGQTDLDGEARINNGAIDIGVDEANTDGGGGNPNAITVWKSANINQHMISFRDFRGRIENENDIGNSSQWKMVPGLAGQGVSFQSIEYPNRYLRHRNYRVWLDVEENNQLFKEDATFFIREGLSDANMVSFEAYNFPSRFMRHRGFWMYVEEIQSDLDKRDATFYKNDAAIKSGNTISEKLIIYPNPVSDILQLQGAEADEIIKIYDTKGRLMLTNQNLDELDVSKLNSGIYFLKTSNLQTSSFVKD